MSNRLTFVEIDIKKCQLDYGVSPCTASGSDKCYNCRSTCQDLDNIDEENETARYSKPSKYQRFDLDVSPNVTIPNIQSVNYTPPTLDLGKSLGVRASITVTFTDLPSPDTDTTGDKYTDSRSYEPYFTGTYWGKFRARYPSLRGQELRWIQGTDDQALGDMETRAFTIESVSGPNSQGIYTITAKDILKLADGDRSQAPAITDINTGSTVITDSYTGNINVGAGNATILGDGYAVLGGEEIVQGEPLLSDGTGATWVINSRAQLNTDAKEHSEESSISPVLSYDAQSPADILYDLLVNYANVDPSYISLPDWQAEATSYINRNYSAGIARSTSVNMLINELIEQTASTMWWDNEAQLIRWQVLKKPLPGATVYNDDNTLAGSFNIRDDYTRRISRCLIFFGQINPLLNLDEFSNYATTVLRLEVESEKPFDNVPAIKKIYSRWIPAAGRAIAERLGDLILQRFSLPPRKIGFRLMRDSGVQLPILGGAYNCANQFIQLPSGQPATLPIQITSITPSAGLYEVNADEITFNDIIAPDDPNTVPVSLDNSENNVNLRQKYDEAGGTTPTSDTVVNVTIGAGVIIGSSSTSTPAMVTGSFPAGATINIICNGYIVGMGGSGGIGASMTYSESPISGASAKITQNATAGTNGGVALELSHPVTITNNNIIGGGGGGGGGAGAGSAGSAGSIAAAVGGSGGGGGAGSISGSGGASGSHTISTAVGTDITTTGTSPVGGLAGGLTETPAYPNGANAYNSGGPGSRTLNVGSGFSGGSGGFLGNDGTAGANGFVNATGFTPAVSKTASGAAGGIAGDAIVTNGNAITWVTMGDIRGDIS